MPGATRPRPSYAFSVSLEGTGITARCGHSQRRVPDSTDIVTADRRTPLLDRLRKLVCLHPPPQQPPGSQRFHLHVDLDVDLDFDLDLDRCPTLAGRRGPSSR